VAQVDALENQRAVTESQTTNDPDDPDDWAFFTFDDLFYIWQFYTECPHELILTTILGISAVSLISMIFIPHWSAVLFVTPIISILYVDLLGFLQVCGISVNAVSYISLAMSIGLLVDFLLHILLRYYESKEATREDKVKDVLRKIGTSILIGGISTFLGVLPLYFSTSDVFNTIFVCFLGLVVFGVTHGLIFLPVVLSMFGPNVVLEL
jgi:Niemann-Pick C1 protein